VACPHCKRQMFYPFVRDLFAVEEVVRCPDGCVQTTINTSNEYIKKMAR